MFVTTEHYDPTSAGIVKTKVPLGEILQSLPPTTTRYVEIETYDPASAGIVTTVFPVKFLVQNC